MPPFVIYAQGRTGSTLLYDLLNSHPLIQCDDELLSAELASPLQYVESLKSRNEVYGFKLKPYHITRVQGADQRAFMQTLDSTGWRTVHLQRRNLVHQALSSTLAAQRSYYHRRISDPSVAGRRTIIDIAEVIRQVREAALVQRQERQALAGMVHLDLVYEDDLLYSDRHQATIDRICAFLGIAPASADTTLVRLSTGKYSEVP